MITLAVRSVNSLFCHASTCLRIGSTFRCISINTARDAVDERERLRAFREHGSKHTDFTAEQAVYSLVCLCIRYLLGKALVFRQAAN
jgi:hypothetical protein